MSLRNPARAAGLMLLMLAGMLCAGCGSDDIGPLHPVKGRVLRNGDPIKVQSGYIVLKADADKGNESPYQPSGKIEPDGSFEIYTKERKGAPPGWYKVVVTATGEVPKPTKSRSRSRPVAKQVVASKYGQEKTTPLSIEVVESPSEDAYDLDVTK